MKFLKLCLFLCLVSHLAFTQAKPQAVPLNDNRQLEMFQVAASPEIYRGKQSLKVVNKGDGGSEATFVKINSLDFQNGTIEVDLAGQPGVGASDQARGFVGIAFRINDDNSNFECFYLRPTNGRADDQLRRNHSAQYFSFPEYPWHRLRKETPGMYETYVDLMPGEWTKLKIEVQGSTARLYVHGNSQPTLIVKDLKHGPDLRGKIGLWIGPGTEAHFANLTVSPKP
jgi:hypothetical protein